MLLILVLCLVFCGCDQSKISPWGEKTAQNGVKNPENGVTVKLTIYVCGAVQSEGYIEVELGTSYYDVVALAGILSQTVLPTFASAYVDGSVNKIVIGYNDGETNRESINVNSALIAARLPVDGLSEDIVNKLADYIETNGKIANRHQLELALGEDFADNFYKLFVAENDYEAD